MIKWNALTIPTMAEINKIPKKWKAISTFSGCGGASLGLRMAQYKVLYANEFVPSAAAVYAANKEPYTKLDMRDIRDVDPKEILRKLNLQVGELDYMDSSPPCKAYSSAAKHSRVGKKADEVVLYSDWISQPVHDLFDHAMRLRDAIKPKVFVAENVPGLATGISKGFFLEIMKKMANGYRVKAAVIDPSYLGVPQRRARLVFVCIRNDLKMDPVFPAPRKEKRVGVSDVIPAAYQVNIGQNEWEDARRPGPVLTTVSAHATESSVMSASGHIRLRDGTIRKLTIKELIRYFGYPTDFKLEEVMVPNKLGNMKKASYGQSWERLARSHVPLQVAAIADKIATDILEPYYAQQKRRRA